MNVMYTDKFVDMALLVIDDSAAFSSMCAMFNVNSTDAYKYLKILAPSRVPSKENAWSDILAIADGRDIILTSEKAKMIVQHHREMLVKITEQRLEIERLLTAPPVAS